MIRKINQKVPCEKNQKKTQLTVITCRNICAIWNAMQEEIILNP